MWADNIDTSFKFSLSKEEEYALYETLWKAADATDKVQSALGLPFRPINLQDIYDLYLKFNRLTSDNKRLKRENDKLFEELWKRTV
jgi:hypothetical protein